MDRPIQPGDTLIFKSETNGGRIVVVHEVTPDGSIIILHSIPGQQKYVEARRRDRFIRPRDAFAAHEAIGRMKQIAEELQRELHDAKTKASNAFRSVQLEYETETDLETAD